MHIENLIPIHSRKDLRIWL